MPKDKGAAKRIGKEKKSTPYATTTTTAVKLEERQPVFSSAHEEQEWVKAQLVKHTRAFQEKLGYTERNYPALPPSLLPVASATTPGLVSVPMELPRAPTTFGELEAMQHEHGQKKKTTAQATSAGTTMKEIRDEPSYVGFLAPVEAARGFVKATCEFVASITFSVAIMMSEAAKTV
jgi:hypothetical protein